MSDARSRPGLVVLAILAGCSPLLYLTVSEWQGQRRAYEESLATAELVEEVRGLIEARQPAEAMRRLRPALEAYPRQVELHNLAAAALERLGRTEDALGHLEILLELAPRQAPLHAKVGSTLLALNRVEEAREAFLRANELIPQRTAYEGLGMIHYREGDCAGAEDYLAVAVGMGGATADSYARLGSCLLQQGRRREARRRFQEALALEPDHAEARSKLALLASGRGGGAGSS